jgi:hypothetical protein
MGIFKSKPATIEAHQFDGKFGTKKKMETEFGVTTISVTTSYNGNLLGWKIKTLGGSHEVESGDWIIKGIAGEFYICKPDIFEATYEAVLKTAE